MLIGSLPTGRSASFRPPLRLPPPPSPSCILSIVHGANRKKLYEAMWYTDNECGDWWQCRLLNFCFWLLLVDWVWLWFEFRCYWALLLSEFIDYWISFLMKCHCSSFYIWTIFRIQINCFVFIIALFFVHRWTYKPLQPNLKSINNSIIAQTHSQQVLI